MDLPWLFAMLQCFEKILWTTRCGILWVVPLLGPVTSAKRWLPSLVLHKIRQRKNCGNRKSFDAKI